MLKKEKLTIDLLKGGNGDIWIRLVSFYSIAALLPHLEISILIPAFMRRLAKHSFGDRLNILETHNEKIKLSYSSAGLRHLVKGFIKGQQYILPYQRSVINDKKKSQVKDKINILLFNFAKSLGLVHIPGWKWINSYQGYLDIIGIKKLKHVNYDDFVQQLRNNSSLIASRLNKNIPCSAELNIPADLKQNILVFPTGTSRQFIPVWWAIKNLPDAYYAFFYKDKDALAFENAGLKTVKFYHEPGDIIALAKNAHWTISTDSFPSHLLQSSVKNCTITITEVLSSRIISPVFEGEIADAVAECHPCLHLDRKNHPLCAAGHSECVNWKSKLYTESILHSVTKKITETV